MFLHPSGVLDPEHVVLVLLRLLCATHVGETAQEFHKIVLV